jgi:transcriptional regulator with XRE-family HTH domain
VASPEYRAAIDVVVQARKAAKLSQREVARRLGKPPSFINKIELLERRLDVLEFLLIAEAIGVDAGELMGAVANDIRAKRQLV